MGEPLAQHLERLAEAGGGHQLRRVERRPAGGDDVEIRDLGGLEDGWQVYLTRQEGRETGRLIHPQQLVEVRPPHVSVDQEHFSRAKLTQRDSEVRRRRGLAVLWLE